MLEKYGRILLKLSGEYLGGPAKQGFDFTIIDSLAQKLCKVHDKGFEVAVVLGGGNFFRGARDLPVKMDRVAADHIGMLATVMNSLCLKECLIARGKTARVMTGLNIPAVAEAFEKRAALKMLSEGHILIFGGGTGNPFFSTDTAAILRALEIEAQIVIKGTLVDGVYNKDPKKHSDAVRYESLRFSEVLEKDLKVMDPAAVALCRENDLPLAVLDITAPDDLLGFLEGRPTGTRVH
ncbi:MAG: UMP kinase [Candidatus Lambdaproteobacteria bacterium RIFOXYD12_FULL_49_8]|uniref:Uridylate kinase n=1 Tax=Candidatus Lambdaproteobacteria bacterium RIFOXYD2_FULL_50_16 TaxID=1817772 RepID=A0A1F6GA99_9PROT|nr:MAG: UMP kinase [Candidatus Lambdaproteobacteria bacterium RIFOXYD2_FULL_50_16]OGG97359.1 MAG: UMP kinase [Candidatus Lambdaproteobacteria bacterium RIFOXYD12_FULL_49_8]